MDPRPERPLPARGATRPINRIMRRTKRIYKASAHAIRGALLLTALAALASLWLWTARSGLVERLDERMFALYTSSYSSRYDDAIALLNAGKSKEGREALEGLLARLGTVRKQERLSPAYSAALKTLISIHGKEGNHERAVELSAKLVELDDRDYSCWLIHARNLEKVNKREEAIEALRAAFRIAPQSIEAAEALTSSLIRSGRTEEAAEAARVYAGANRGGNLALYYASEERPAPVKGGALNSTAFTGRAQSFVLPIGATGASRLMITMSGLMDTEVELISLFVDTPEGRERIDPEAVNFGVEELRPMGRSVWAATAGADPVVFFNLPRRLWTERLLTLELTAAFRPRLSDGLKGLLKERRDG